MKILAIDTSCDDTSVAISDGRNILSNVFWSKLKLHSEWGGVVPSVAKRQHEEFLTPAINKVLEEANLSLDDIDYFAVTFGPGLAIALEPGLERAKQLALNYNKPLIPINHMVAHIYANLAKDQDHTPLSNVEEFDFPALALTISGGHTDLYQMSSHLKFEHIGWTLDDAIGEAFDKVGRLLGLGFPAGHQIESLAQTGDENRFKLPRPLYNTDDFYWSYSGLKTAVLYEIHKLTGQYSSDQVKGKIKLLDASKHLNQQDVADMAASFQKAAVDSLLHKVEKAIRQFKPKMLIIGGGVIANHYLRAKFDVLTASYGVKLTFPHPMWLCTDNAAMIAVAANYYIKAGKFIDHASDVEHLDRAPSLSIKSDRFLIG